MRKLLAFQGSTDNQECPQTSAGWDGLIFGPNFADAALVGPRSSPFAHLGCKELWVYTDATNTIATNFYTTLGFAILGPVIESAPGLTMDVQYSIETNSSPDLSKRLAFLRLVAYR